MSANPPVATSALPRRLKWIFPLGDHTINVSLGAVSLFYLYFLTEVAGLRPALASLVMLTGRAVDAFTDPAMGRISDMTRWRSGRRRPYFLIGAIPFGVTFALLWQRTDADSQMLRFAFYGGVYVLHTLSSTVLAVPYMALLPEIAADYQDRTVLNMFRSGAVLVGILLAAAGMPALVEELGGGAGGYACAGALLGVWLALPWFAVHRVTWERTDIAHATRMSLKRSFTSVLRHRAYRHLVGLFLSARIAVDMVGAMLIFYVHYWLGRPGDFPLTIVMLLVGAIAALPLWLRLSRSMDKRTLFIAGASWWIGAQAVMLGLGPDWPRWTMFAAAAAAGFGYIVADLMPWSMLGDVIDADELATGERRDGIYAGLFTFLRKLGGAGGVAFAGIVLDVFGFEPGARQSDSVLRAIRYLTVVGPSIFLLIAVYLAASYPLSRERHAEIVRRLRRRGRDAPERGGGAETTTS
jgi:sugar (glycoside-pentoside-hexuronide) transporter